MTKIEQRERKRCIEIPRTVSIFSDIVRIAINMLQYSTTNVVKQERYSIYNLHRKYCQ